MKAALPIRIKLTESEQQLFDQIEFVPNPGREKAVVSSKASHELMTSLLKRDAIPEVRKSFFFTDPFPGGRGKTHLEVFESNLGGRNLYEDSSFINFYLRYFIFGPDLPLGAIKRFCTIVDEGELARDMRERLRSFVRQETRNAERSKRHSYPEEFYKLALECIPDDPFIAKSIRDAAMQAR